MTDVQKPSRRLPVRRWRRSGGVPSVELVEADSRQMWLTDTGGMTSDAPSAGQCHRLCLNRLRTGDAERIVVGVAGGRELFPTHDIPAFET